MERDAGVSRRRQRDSARRSPRIALSISLTALAALALLPATASAYIYFASDQPDGSGGGSAIGRANTDSTQANENFLFRPSDLITPWGVAANATHVYWSDNGTGSISRAKLDGTGVQNGLITGLAGPASIAISSTYVYWVDYEANTIGRANLDGSGVDRRFIIGADSPNGIAIDGSHIYWTNHAGSIGRANLDGTGINQSFITGADDPTDVAVDAGHVYWESGRAPATIGRANLDGTGVNQTFITDSAANLVKSLAVDGGHIYWTSVADTNGGSVGRANLDGTSINHLFINGTGDGRDVAISASHIYWAEAGDRRIGRANLDGSGANHSFIDGGPGGLEGGANGMTVAGDYLYWASFETIGRVKPDGTAVKRDLIYLPWPGVALGIEVDSSHIYWAGYGEIGRAKLDGSEVEGKLVTGAATGYDGGLAIDSEHLYWANTGFDTIGRANLDGSEVDQSFIKGVRDPTDVEVNSQHIYWAGYGEIGRADLDGSSVDQSFIKDTGLQSTELALTARHIYWTDWGRNGIGRARLDGTHVVREFLTGYAKLGALAIDGLGPIDTTAPDISISKHPRSPVKTAKSRINVTFAFSSEPGSTLACKLDSAEYEPCTSPRGYRVKTGRHSFSISATDEADNTGEKSFSFKVKKVPTAQGGPGGSAGTPPPFLSLGRVQKAASVRASELCAKNSRCTGSSAQCDERLARNIFNCYINTYFPGPLGPHDKNCAFINRWALNGDPPKLRHRRYEKGGYPGGPYGMACEGGPD